MRPGYNHPIAVALMLLAVLSCRRIPGGAEPSSEALDIYPDYTGITIPPNVAPLNFRILNPGQRYVVHWSGSGVDLVASTRNGKARIPMRKWKKLTGASRGAAISLVVFRKDPANGWQRLDTVTIRVAEEEIDPYIAFRKILPANILWKDMGIYQRSLESFEEKPIMVNSLSGENCMNCHSFNNGRPEQFLFHMRGAYGGTVIQSGESASFIDTHSEHTRAAGVYPAWHPGGELVALSVNKINQGFHSRIGKMSYVYDRYSDIVIYNLNTNRITRPAELATENLENMPAWSADGEGLYFICTGTHEEFEPYDQKRYSLLRIPFDPQSISFGEMDTLILADSSGMSITFPRERPGGALLSFIGVDYGYFSIYNREADVYLLDLSTGKIRKPGINSAHTESYPSWSQNGAWLMFVSKRGDGLLSQPWFSYVDGSGACAKPFVLPQKDPDFYSEYMYNYNRPEFITGNVKLTPRKVLSLARGGARAVEFNKEGSVDIMSGATSSPEEEIGQEGGIYSHD